MNRNDKEGNINTNQISRLHGLLDYLWFIFFEVVEFFFWTRALGGKGGQHPHHQPTNSAHIQEERTSTFVSQRQGFLLSKLCQTKRFLSPSLTKMDDEQTVFKCASVATESPLEIAAPTEEILCVSDEILTVEATSELPNIASNIAFHFLIAFSAVQADAAQISSIDEPKQEAVPHSNIRIYWHPACSLHENPDHPERPGRVDEALKALRNAFSSESFSEAPLVDDDTISLFHTESHLEALKELFDQSELERTYKMIDGDTVVMWNTRDAVYRAAGSLVAAIDDVVGEKSVRSIVVFDITIQ